MRTRLPGVCALLLGIASLVPTAPLPASAAPVLDDVASTRAQEEHPTATSEYVAWVVYNPRTKRGNVRVKPEGEPAFTADTVGVNAATGAIDGTTLVYQGYSRDASSIRFLDLVTGATTDAPDAVNTHDWEYWPELSGSMLLFGRIFADGDRDLILYDLSDDTSVTLDHTTGWRSDIWPGQVNGNFAVWATFASGSCQAYVYDIAAATTTAVPRPRDRCQYGASVTSDGTVFLGQSGYRCGRDARVLEYPVGGPVETVLRLDRGEDFAFTYAVENGDGTTTIFLDPGPCGEDQDIKSMTI